MDRKAFLRLMVQAGTGAFCCRSATAVVGPAQDPSTGPARSAWNADLEHRVKEGARATAARRMEFAEGWVQRLMENLDQVLDHETTVKLM